MTYEARQIAGDEAALRHPGGDVDLTAHRGDWYVLAPRHRDEIIDVSALDVLLAGPGLASRLDRLGGDQLEIEFFLADRFGHTGRVAGLTPVTVEGRVDFRGGQHNGTMMDPDAGMLGDGSQRPGLRLSTPLVAPPPPTAAWVSDPVPLRYGSVVESVAWDVVDVHRSDGSPSGAYGIEFRAGHDGAGGQPSWPAWQTVTADAQDRTRQEHVFDASPPVGSLAQWRITLRAPAPDDVHVGPAPVVFALAARVRLAAPRWSFTSLADLLLRGDENHDIRPGAWGAGGQDVVLLHVPVFVRLGGERKESLRARLGAPGGDLSAMRIRARADLSFADRS